MPDKKLSRDVLARPRIDLDGPIARPVAPLLALAELHATVRGAGATQPLAAAGADVFTLSPTAPIGPHGMLVPNHPSSVWPAPPLVCFDPIAGAPDVPRSVGLRLMGLAGAGIYVVQARVQAGGAGSFVGVFEAQTVTIPVTDARAVVVPIAVVMPGPRDFWVTIRAVDMPSWSFSDATVTRLDPH